MEVALMFLTKAIGGGIVGHYLKKLLEKLDAQFVQMLEQGESIETIGAYVREAGLEDKVIAVAGKAIDKSIVVTLGGDDIPTVDDKCQLFTDLVRLAFDVSSKLQVDLLLPGSFVGADTYSLFSPSLSQSTEVSVDELKIHLPKRYDDSGLYVFPAPRSLLGQDRTWSQYKTAIRERRQSTKEYLSIKSDFSFLSSLIDKYAVDYITPGVLCYMYRLIMPKNRQRAIGAKSGEVRLDQWTEGVFPMVGALQEIKDLQILDPGELEDIVRLQSRLRDLSSFA